MTAAPKFIAVPDQDGLFGDYTFYGMADETDTPWASDCQEWVLDSGEPTSVTVYRVDPTPVRKLRWNLEPPDDDE